jgi:hypothetical protein
MKQSISRIILTAAADPAKSLARRAADQAVGTIFAYELSPRRSIQIGYARLNGAGVWKISPIARLQDGVYVDGSQGTKPG